MIPGLYDGHDKAFFFFHYEQIRFPNSFTRTRTVYNQKVLDGVFRYQFGNEVREVNLLTLAAANGQITAKDPTMTHLFGLIDAVDEDDGHARRRRRSALRQLRLAEPLGAVRAPADDAGGLQPVAGQPAERIVRVDPDEPHARLSEQHRPALPGRAQSARLHLQAAAAVAQHALGPVEGHSSTSCAAG